jgi:hypothetical protein
MINSLDRRCAQAEAGDVAGVLHRAALVEVAELLRVISEPPFDQSTELAAEVLTTALRLHWYRYLALPAEADEPDRVRSLDLLAQLLELDASRTPTDVAESALKDLLRRLRRRALTEDPQLLLSPVATVEVRCLAAFLKRVRLAVDSEHLAAVHLLAQLRWRRYMAMPPYWGEEELVAALRGFESIYQPDYSVVPPLVREYLDGLQPPPRGQGSIPFLAGWHGATIGSPEQLRFTGEVVLRDRRALVEATDDAARLAASARLCSGLLLRYMAGLRRRDLDEALAQGLAIIDWRTSAPLEIFAEVVRVVGRALAMRADADGDEDDRTRAVNMLCDAVNRLGLTHSAVPGIVDALVIAVGTRPAQIGETADIDRIIAMVDQCADRCPDDRSKWRNRRMLLQVARYQNTLDEADLDEAIAIGMGETSPVPSQDPDHRTALSQLAHAFHSRFQRTGTITDLSQAITQMRRVVKWGGDAAGPWDREALGHWLHERYALVGVPGDAEDAYAVLSSLVRDHASVSPEVLGNAVATALQADVLTEEHELQEAVRLLRLVERSADPNDPTIRVNTLVNLASALRALHDASGATGVLDEAANMAATAVSLSSADHPQHATVLEAYARIMVHRGAPADVDTAVHAATRAVEHAPNAARRAELQSFLASLRIVRAQTEAGRPDDHAAGMAAYQVVARTVEARTEVRRTASMLWAQESAKLGDFGSAALGYAKALELVADQIWQTTPLSKRRSETNTWAWAARKGAACAIRAGKPQLAVELLERGRAVISGQILQRRADIALVREVRPDLADRMQWLQRTLEGFDQQATAEDFWEYVRGAAGMFALRMGDPESNYNAFPDWFPHDFEGVQALISDMLDERNDHPQDLGLAAVEEWNAIVGQLRREPAFERIGRPPAVEELQSAAAGGAVVVANVSPIGFDALIVTTDWVHSVPLPDLSQEAAHHARRELLSVVFALEAGDRSPAARRRSRKVMTSVQEWLWEAIAAPVLAALEHDGQPPPGAPWPRVWWCLTGPLAGLPVHAAKSGSQPDANVMDRVVSSYTTTIAALLRARQTTPRNLEGGRPPRFLAVGMPDTPGAPPLRGVELEVTELQRQLPGSDQPLMGAHATVDRVVHELAGHDWVHFACHGTPTVEEYPARLYLHDGPLSVYRIGWSAFDRADLAYLSACHTADTSFSLPDEADHLVAAFQTAGYRHVVGTLWGAGDRIAAGVASHFYRHLSGPGGLDSDRAAEALHSAVRRVREEHPDLPLLWAPFVHFGP